MGLNKMGLAQKKKKMGLNFWNNFYLDILILKND